jgi:trimethylamine--corrinoid protein Co-methyltransferase
MTLRVSLLSQSDIEGLHDRTLDVLEKIGIKFNSLKALEILADAGCEIDRDELSAKIPPQLVGKPAQPGDPGSSRSR